MEEEHSMLMETIECLVLVKGFMVGLGGVALAFSHLQFVYYSLILILCAFGDGK